MTPECLVEIERGGFVEGRHFGHAVICDSTGAILEAWGNPEQEIYPRSSCKMLQAIPLVEGGAELTTQQLALSCASHQGAALHVEQVTKWLHELGLSETDLRCGVQKPEDKKERGRLRESMSAPCQLHNNCSGKHAGFLMLNQKLKGDAEYVEPDHPVQIAVRHAFEDMTEMKSPGYGIDGCSAPNFRTKLSALAYAMARMANPSSLGKTRGAAAERLVSAMRLHPELVAGESRACTELMQAMGGRVAVKTGAEAVFVAILPEKKLGIALKIEDGSTRASECVIAALLVRLGVADPDHPLVKKRLNPEQRNWRGVLFGHIRPAKTLVK